MDENIIAWNVTNWVTVILMAAIGFFLLGVATKFIQKKRNPPLSSVNTSVNGATSLAG